MKRFAVIILSAFLFLAPSAFANVTPDSSVTYGDKTYSSWISFLLDDGSQQVVRYFNPSDVSFSGTETLYFSDMIDYRYDPVTNTLIDSPAQISVLYTLSDLQSRSSFTSSLSSSELSALGSSSDPDSDNLPLIPEGSISALIINIVQWMAVLLGVFALITAFPLGIKLIRRAFPNSY